jgi:excisionase family DNA binding protein
VTAAANAAPVPAEKLLLTVDEAAAALGISRSNLFNILGAGGIASVKVGRLRRIPAAELDRFVARLLEQSPATP